MKKFGKFVAVVLSTAACVGGAYYLMKKFMNKDAEDDFDEFEDDFEDFDSDEEEKEKEPADDRGYVTLNLQEAAEENAAPAEEETASPQQEAQTPAGEKKEPEASAEEKKDQE